MPVSTDPLALGLTWSALLLATSLYGLMVRRRAIDRRRVANETRDAARAFEDGLSRMPAPPADAPTAGVTATNRGQDHGTAGTGDDPMPPNEISLRSAPDLV